MAGEMMALLAWPRYESILGWKGRLTERFLVDILLYTVVVLQQAAGYVPYQGWTWKWGAEEGRKWRGWENAPGFMIRVLAPFRLKCCHFNVDGCLKMEGQPLQTRRRLTFGWYSDALFEIFTGLLLLAIGVIRQPSHHVPPPRHSP